VTVDLAALRALGAMAPITVTAGRMPRPAVRHSLELERILNLPRTQGYSDLERAAVGPHYSCKPKD